MDYKVTILGNTRICQALIEDLLSAGQKIDLVVTLGPDATAKANISGRADIIGLCERAGIAHHQATSFSLRSEADAAFFSQNDFDIGICTDWQRLLPAALLERFRSGVFGWHGSLFPFPNGRGRSPLNWSIRLGGERVFHNCFRYDAGADDGPVFDTRVFPIRPDDDIRQVQYKALTHVRDSSRALLEAHRKGDLAGCLQAQPPGASVHFPKLTEADGELFPDRMTALQVNQIVRSCSRPFPGAFLCVNDKPAIRVWACSLCETPGAAGFEPGQVVDAEVGFIRVRCVDGDLLVTDWERIGEPSQSPAAGDLLTRSTGHAGPA